jgi:hypothetical protein
MNSILFTIYYYLKLILYLKIFFLIIQILYLKNRINIEVNHYIYDYVWFNGHKDSSGMCKWIYSGEQITSIKQWLSCYPNCYSGFHYLGMCATPGDN